MQCPICNERELASEYANQIEACDQCARDYGIIPMPPVTRPPTPCSKCGSKKFVHAVPREHASVHSTSLPQNVSAPMMVTFPPQRLALVFGSIPTIDLKSGYGLLEVYLCYGCGAVEWYCNGVERIPLHKHLMTELVDYDQNGPHR
jgi:hypothetical protein